MPVRRLPISCEPCRTRKIRCPRDAPPCGTCLRRGIPQAECRYTQRATTPASFTSPLNATTPSRPGPLPSPDASDDHDLAERVQRLEQLVQTRRASEPAAVTTNPAPRPLLIPASSPWSRSHPTQALRETDFTGVLRTADSGHVRFVPSSLDWEAKLKLPEHTFGQTDISTPSSRSFDTGNHFRFNEFLAALPPRSHCTELVRIYFTSFASLFHILHNPTFHRKYDGFLQEPESVPLAWLALLYAVLGTAVLALPSDSHLLHDLSRQPNPLLKMADLSERYRSLSMRCLEADHYLWDHNVTTLQALIFIIYGISHSHGQAFTLIGLTYHLALSIGCHVDPTAFNLDVVEIEERRRCWAGLKMLYSNQNVATGHIGLSHALLPSNCRLPIDVNDEFLVPGHFVLVQATNPSGATQMTYLLLKFRLYDLCSEICYRVLGQKNVDADAIRQIDALLQEEQKTWETRYGDAARVESLPPHHLAHINILYSYANHLMLLLHHANAVDPVADQELSHWSRSRCLESAKSLLEIHAFLQECPDFEPFRWYNRGLGSFHAFHAAVVLVALNRSDIEPVRQPLQRCLEIFRAMSDISPLCANATPILQQLM